MKKYKKFTIKPFLMVLNRGNKVLMIRYNFTQVSTYNFSYNHKDKLSIISSNLQQDFWKSWDIAITIKIIPEIITFCTVQNFSTKQRVFSSVGPLKDTTDGCCWYIRLVLLLLWVDTLPGIVLSIIYSTFRYGRLMIKSLLISLMSGILS